MAYFLGFLVSIKTLVTLDRPSIANEFPREKRRGIQIDDIIKRIRDESAESNTTNNGSTTSLEIGTLIPKLKHKDTATSNTTLNDSNSSYSLCGTRGGAFGDRIELKDVKKVIGTLDHWRRSHNPLSH